MASPVDCVGFVGTGTIAGCVVRGLCTCDAAGAPSFPHRKLLLSPRSASRAEVSPLPPYAPLPSRRCHR
jgi:hypothetical protein